MNSLEFIEKLISDIDTAIRLRKIDASVYEALDDDEEIESNQYALKQLEDYMQHFQQIKLELEAWYEIKNLYLKGYFSRIALPMGCYEKFKKALEVEE